MLLELSLYAKNLKNVAGAFKGTSDPFAVVTRMATTPGTQAEVLGKTEVVKNSLSPEWAKVFVFDYELGTPVKLAVSVFDEVKKKDNKSMGSSVFDIGELLGARGNTKAKKLKGGGNLYATVRKSHGSGVLRLKMSGVKLENTEGFMRKSDPFFELCRKVDNAGANTWDNVFRSETVKDNLSPDWKEATIDLSILCGGDQNLPIQVNVYDYESSGKHVPMGSFETTVTALVSLASGAKEMVLKTKAKETGKIVVSKAEISGVSTKGPTSSSSGSTTSTVTTKLAGTAISAPSPRPTFVDYVSGGCELNVVVAIDFTGSNGDPRQPGTLHYLKAQVKNDYEKAISSIVGILSAYDTDKKFSVLGFGAKYGGVIQHSFQCGPTEEVYGVQGVLDAYHRVFASGLVMSGPTVFNDVIRAAAARAERSLASGRQVYTILLILSDGAVSDPNGTAECLRQCSNAPLSVVIVGVGNADFTSMQFLDDCSGPGERDMAQFVPFNQHNRDPTDLSAATLQEIPGQLVGFFQKRGIQPNANIRAMSGEILVENEEEIDLALNLDGEEIVVAGGGIARSTW